MQYKIGQKVVRIADPEDKESPHRKGDIRTVIDELICSCGRQKIDIGANLPALSKGCKCDYCGEIRLGTTWWNDSTLWAPLIEARESFQAVSYEKIFKELVAPVSVN